MLNTILELFPSGIVLYNGNQGIFYKNKFWLSLVNKYINPKYQLSEGKKDYTQMFNHADNQNNNDNFINSLKLVENKNHNLLNEMSKIYAKIHDSEVKKLKVRKYGCDSFVQKENINFCEYEIKDKDGKQVSEFNAKFSVFNFSQADTIVMAVVNDISERTRIKETKLSEKLKTIML